MTILFGVDGGSCFRGGCCGGKIVEPRNEKCGEGRVGIDGG